MRRQRPAFDTPAAQPYVAFEMTMSAGIVPQSVVPELQKHILVDGFRIVIDLEKSSGARLVDAVTGREFLDLYGFFGSMAIGFNHPYFNRPDVHQDLLATIRTKVANA